ncbi:hypothetical protein [Robertmurraya sp. FSL R5-0851]|uniref:hypothetical protein n=1 Tax=Robertmurraya sp. FSL R5-0851 TaxID=2921584 RepID=UPI0030F59641
MKFVKSFISGIIMILCIDFSDVYAKGDLISANNPIEEKDILVGEITEAKIKLFAKETDEKLVNFRLELNGSQRFFPFWQNVVNKAYWPKLFYSDITKDDKKELIIVLTKGYGTGVLEEEIHVFNQVKSNDGYIYQEVLVDNPLAIVLRNTKTKLTNKEAIITIGEKKSIIKLDDLEINPDNLFPDIYSGNIIRFDVSNGELISTIGATISPSGYIGDFKITYTLKDKLYQMKNIEFIPVN